MVSRSPRHWRRTEGLTLVELLVTVVILGFVIALMSGAFFQVAQVLRVATASGNGFQARWQQSRALHDVVGNLVYLETEAPSLVGRADRFDCVTLASPVGVPGVAEMLSVALVSSGDERTRLVLAPLEATGLSDTAVLGSGRANDLGKGIEWTQWPGRLEFRYVDADGAEHATWPPMGAAATNEAPRAVVIRETGQASAIRVAVYEGGRAPPSTGRLQDVFGGGAP